MSKGLKYYSHYSNSHNHWKFKRLRSVYGWEGEGKFWALNNMIAASDECKLDLSNEEKREQIAADLDFSLEEFNDFIKHLVEKFRLVKNGDGRYITDNTQEDLEVFEKKRKYDRERKDNQ